MRNRIFNLLFLFFSLFFLHSVVIADVTINHNIIVDTTWNEIDSPYIIEGIIQIYPNITLTIEPNVIVKLKWGGSRIEVYGKLLAIGEEKKPISFFPNDDQAYNNGGIWFFDSSEDAIYDSEGNYINGSVISYCNISGLIDALRCENASPFIFANTFDACHGYWHPGVHYRQMILFKNSNNINFLRNKVINSGLGSIGGALIGGPDYDKLIYITNSYGVFKNNILKDNDMLPLFLIENSSINFENNEFYNNSGHDVQLWKGTGSHFVSFSGNNFSRFNEYCYNIILTSSWNTDVNAQNNWWGTIEPMEIYGTIHDYYDDMDCKTVDFNPYATSPYSLMTPINYSPIANAGQDQTVYSSVILDGSSSSDTDGTIVTWNWSLTHRTNPSYNFAIAGESPGVQNLHRGFYDVILTVIDNYGAISMDSMLLGVAGPWDINSDDKTGLAEAVHALQVVSGIRPE